MNEDNLKLKKIASDERELKQMYLLSQDPVVQLRIEKLMTQIYMDKLETCERIFVRKNVDFSKRAWVNNSRYQ